MSMTAIVQHLRENVGKMRSVEYRREQLRALLRCIDENLDRWIEVLRKDLHKPKMECMGMEVNYTRNELIVHLNNLDEWTKPEYVKKELPQMRDECYIQYEPLGVILVIGAWNYPVQLVLCPLIAAISAGNCAVVKPSELSEATAALVEDLLPKYLDKDCFAVVNGGVKETTELLEQKFDHIMYTGNSNVGRIVMAAAAKHLTPVTLELGGKSPCYVDKDCDVDVAARRIAWGRFVNCGQTCIAPDYVLCASQNQDRLLKGIQAALEEYFGKDPRQSEDYCRIVNQRHFHRVKSMIEKTKGSIALGGDSDEKDLYISPTVVKDVKPTDALMEAEIFGPVLPIVTAESADDAVRFINSRDKPLALYAFANDKKVIHDIVQRTSSGSVCGNDTMMQMALPTLPFGGVGTSGMGNYHGKFGFLTFSHRKAVMVKALAMEKVNSIRYPPYTEKKMSWINWLTNKKEKRRGGLFSFMPFAVIMTILAVLLKVLTVMTYLA
ncbi:aldehyde dehydrogenase, dimeric NADP-preferring-like isoform X1 [Branchiostoma floridae]|uniref:Aldehyde dehydrogenase n=1 Tax=Branchiostoma floridae TaxID=7739 RepID=A0A9J7LYG8_BRAFL|nr:aldehyde dehydrogenase, dimeric NADP-preferring-like isoform X1 [Branchiostoma floridae]